MVWLRSGKYSAGTDSWWRRKVAAVSSDWYLYIQGTLGLPGLPDIRRDLNFDNVLQLVGPTVLVQVLNLAMFRETVF